MLTRNKLQRGEEKLKSFDHEAGCTPRRRNMADEEARMEEERNYHKIFFIMVDKVDKLFPEYEKTIKPEKKESDDHASVNHGDGEEETPPSPSSSDNSSSYSSHHSNKHHRSASKNSFFMLYVKFDLPVFSREYNVEKLDN